MSVPKRPPLSVRTQIYVAIVVGVGLYAVAVSLIDVGRRPLDWQHFKWLKLALLTLASGWLSVKLPSVSASISISETFVFAGTLLFGPSVGTTLVLLDAIVLCVKSQWSRKKLRWERSEERRVGKECSCGWTRYQ